MKPVATVPQSTRKTTIGEQCQLHAFVWLAFREMDGYRRIIVSDAAVPGWEEAGTLIALEKGDGTSYHEWQIEAVVTDGKLMSGKADYEARQMYHRVGKA